MTYDEFITTYTNKPVDFDGAYGVQCMDLMHQYVYDVCGLKDRAYLAAQYARNVYENFDSISGHQFFERIANTPTGVPQKGDIIFWGSAVGVAGHVAIFISGNADTFKSFDANWPTGTNPHIQDHNYNGVLGWLRLKTQIPVTPTPVIGQSKEQIIIDAYVALTNQAPSNDEKQWHLNANENTVELIKSLTGDSRFFDLFIKPKLDDLQFKLDNETQKLDTVLKANNVLSAKLSETQLALEACQQSLTECQNKPTPTVPVDDSTLRLQAKSILYGKGWWWTKWAAIKELFPNA